jgi:hypothetical protein
LAGETGKANEPARESTGRQQSRFEEFVKQVSNGRLAEKDQERLAQKESRSERDGRRTATAIVWMAIFTIVLAIVSMATGIILFRQLGEMQGSGRQTDRLLGLYQQQLDLLEKQAGDTHELAGEAKIQADASKTIAEKANTQAKATNKLATETARSATTASRQLKVMQEQFAISQRPWLNVTSSTSPNKSGPDYDFRWGGNNVLFKPNLTVTNLGNLPAVNVHLVEQLIFPDLVRSSARKDIRTAQKDFCEKQIDTGIYRNWKSGQIIYPSSEKPFTEIEASRDRATLLAINPKSINRGPVHPFLVGCAIYSFSSSTETYQKGFIFQIERRVEPGQSSEMFFGQNVSGSEIYLDDAYDGDAFLN